MTKRYWVRRMIDFTFEIAGKFIISEVIEGEAIILNMNTGEYFSAENVGAEIWQHALAGHSYRAIVDSASAFYVGAPAIVEKIDEFLVKAEAAKLLKREPALEVGSGNSGPRWQSPYIDPELVSHAHVSDLMELDPIHEVAEAGWPLQMAIPEEQPPLQWPTRSKQADS